MQTEWHDYKSAKTRRTAGSYFYLPEVSDNVLAHAIRLLDGQYHLHSYVLWITCSGPFASLAEAKLHAARQAAQHLGLTPPEPERTLQPKLF